MKFTEKEIVASIGLLAFALMFVGPALALLFVGWVFAIKAFVAFALIFVLMMIWDFVID